MQYKTEPSEKSTVRITMTFDKAEWDEANQKAYLRTRGRYAVNGFRKGKAPKHVIELNYGKGVFYEDALTDLFNDHYPEAIEKEKDNFTVVGQADLSVEDIGENGAVLVAVAPVKPEVKLGAYKGIKVRKAEYNVKDADVEAELSRLQERNSRLAEVEGRAAENGDTATIDFSGSVNGEKFAGGTAENYDLVLGSGSFIPGFEEQVVGMNVGESKDVNVKFPDDYQAEELKGKDAVFAVTLHKLRRKELPEVNDEFIKDAAGAESVEAYKKETRERLEKQAKERGDAETENNLVKRSPITRSGDPRRDDRERDGQHGALGGVPPRHAVRRHETCRLPALHGHGRGVLPRGLPRTGEREREGPPRRGGDHQGRRAEGGGERRRREDRRARQSRRKDGRRV